VNRDFVLLWQGQLVSQLGNQVYAIALAFWVMEATNSASLIGLLMGLVALPALVFGPFGGTFADRHSRRTIIIVADIANGLLVLALGVAFLVRPEQTVFLLVATTLVTLAAGVAQAFFRPAITAAIADLVPGARLGAANAWVQGAGALVLILGQALGGVLYAALGVGLLFLLNGSTFLFSAASESFMRLPDPRTSPPDRSQHVVRTYLRETREGFDYLWSQKGLRQLVLAFSVMAFAGGPIAVLFPFYVKDSLGKGVEFYGFLIATAGAGAVLGYLIAGRVRLTGQSAMWLVVCPLLGVCVLVALAGQITAPTPAFITFYVLGEPSHSSIQSAPVSYPWAWRSVGSSQTSQGRTCR